jgi:two-component system chemotaxis sensor kinase CheA
VASAALVAANVLRRVGATAAAERIAAAAAAGPLDDAAERVRSAIAAALAGDLGHEAAAAPTEARPETIRVPAARLDALLRLAGELTVAKNAIGDAAARARRDDAAFAAMLGERHAVLDRLVVELQRAVLDIRVLPLRAALRRFPRLVREMSAELGKPAELTIEGDDTEADRTIVESLVDPLLHVLRNAMDHGIESPGPRAAAGKPPVAAIRVRASRQGERLSVEVSDDGAGVDVARVREVARRRNLMSEEALAELSDADAVALIFSPGFSTAPVVTDISGRGVGMDAVRSAVGRVGGHVDAVSVPGQGLTVRFSLPFSVLMTRVLTIHAGGHRLGIPLDAVVETLRVPAASIHAVGAARAVVIKERTVPLLDLAQVLDTAASAAASDEALVVVTRAAGSVGALRVDRIGEHLEVMLKPFEALLAGTPGIAGSALLGDGSILLVIDVAELMR